MASNGSAVNSNNCDDIDESLYSRQLYVLGHNAMRRMAASHVLISGMGGLGVEIAKNVILSGVKSVTIHDESTTQFTDLSTQYYLSEEDMGANRADASLSGLCELNPYVTVTTYTGKLSHDFLNKFRVVVLTESSLTEQKAISDYTHSHNIALIIASTKGLFGQLFCDFGDNFEVNDTSGEQPLSVMIGSVSNAADGVVVTLDKTRHRFYTGDKVTFKEVRGMTELNGGEPRTIHVLDPFSFSIGDTSAFGPYERGGYATQVTESKIVTFKPLRESLADPAFVPSDFSKTERRPQLHVAFRALHAFIERNGRHPNSWSDADADQFLAIVTDMCARHMPDIQIDEKLMRLFSYLSGGNVAPMNAVIGGTATQEVLKACSGKFSPIHQWLYFDALECLPLDPQDYPKEADCLPTGSRYDAQIAVFGPAFQQLLANKKLFMVGAGAIGCELLKNFAMIGLATGQKGALWVTDMDIIERSNLNRQFLFRPTDVGQYKSLTAATAVRRMNSNLNIVYHQNRVGAETEQIYDDTFFQRLDLVVNALDNLDARLYMDSRCVYYRKPLLESGTLGTKGNVQVVLPFLTESYSSTPRTPEKSIPMCTLKSFPNAIEHTIQWARDDFEGLFTQSAENAFKYLKDPKFIEQTMRMSGNESIVILENVKRILVNDRADTFDECVQWARDYFEEQYANQIKQLLFNFPADSMTSSGAPFWSGPKRCPQPIEFDPNNRTHLDYIVAAANLKAHVYNIPYNRNNNAIKDYVSTHVVNEFTPRAGLRISVNDGDVSADAGSDLADADRMQQLLYDIPAANTLSHFAINPVHFEKDDDSNFHMDYITAASNLRADNYHIENADRHKCKLIAGRIVPAIATTTSLVAGLVCLELYKIIAGHNTLKAYKNGFVNLAVPFFGFSQPVPARVDTYYDHKWTIWDRFELEGEKTLKELINYFADKHKLMVTMILQNAWILYADDDESPDLMDLKMSEILKRVSKGNIDPWIKSIVFELCCNDSNGKNVKVPYVCYNLPG